MTLLAIDGLTVGYGGANALDEVSLTIDAGEIVGIVGASGSGKSTLALAAIDLLPEGATIGGSRRFEGRSIETLSERERNALRGAGIGLVFQDPTAALDPRMTIGAQVAEAIRAHHRIGRRTAFRQAAETLVRCGLDVSPKRYPHQLSGGQRQRAGIAIANRPRLLIADEPATALDAITQAHILALLRTLVAEEGMALMVISHDLALVAGIADRIVVMAQGRIIEQGPTARVIAAPSTDYARRLIDAATMPVGHASTPAQPLLETEALSFAYGPSLAVSDASFTIGRGEIVGLIGASGSGKSSLLRLVLALSEPKAGAIRLRGQSLAHARGAALRALRRQVQGVFQHPRASFDPRWRVRDIVAEPLALLDRGESHAGRVERAIHRVGLLPELLDRLPHQLSGGERQRVAIARAIVLEPALVVLDEATSALDPISRADIFRLIAGLADTQGIAFLIATHDLAMMRGFADRLLVMEAGRIVEQGPTAALLAAPAHAHTRALIAATPALVPDPANP